MNQNVCPNCGYCPHCGRASGWYLTPQYPFYPSLPWYPQYPTWIAASQSTIPAETYGTTNTSGTGTFTGNN